MRLADRRDTLRAGHQAEDLDASRSDGLDGVDRGHERTAGGQHRIDDDDVGFGDVGGKLVVVGDRFQRFLIAIEPQVPDSSFRNELQDPVGHAQTGAQHRHQGQIHRQSFPLATGNRRVHLDVDRRVVAGELEGHQAGDLPEQHPKLLHAGAPVAGQRQALLNQRMRNHVHVGIVRHVRLRGRRVGRGDRSPVLKAISSPPRPNRIAGDPGSVAGIRGRVKVWSRSLRQNACSLHRAETPLRYRPNGSLFKPTNPRGTGAGPRPHRARRRMPAGPPPGASLPVDASRRRHGAAAPARQSAMPR